MQAIRIFQIYYDEESRQQLDPAFIPLDNSENPRPDWSEYWPIRRLLAREKFTDSTYVGVISPRFSEKTGMDGASVHDVVARAQAEIISFSPFFAQNALHQSSFHQGEAHHPGLIKRSQGVADLLGLKVNVSELIADQTTTIFANYFVARYSFWKVWFPAAEKIFRICERFEGVLGEALSSGTIHRGEMFAPMKVFVMERLVSLLMESRGLRAEIGIDVRKAPPGLRAMDGMIDQLLACDALKAQYRQTGQAAFRDEFFALRNEIVRNLCNTGMLPPSLAAYVS